MKKFQRLFIALAIFLSGIALIPYIGLSSEPFRWQQYADVYEPLPTQIDIQDFAFVPQTVLVVAGTTVRWTNQDGVNHTVTSDEGLFDSGTLLSGESFEHLFDTPGTYSYSCSIHPSMTGRVIVVASTADIFKVFLPIVIQEAQN